MTKKLLLAHKKAELLNHGKIYIPNEIKMPYPLDRSTAGPGAGKTSMAFSTDNMNVKLEVTRNDSNNMFSLKKMNNGFCILKNNNIFLNEISIIPTLFHAPGQIFINIENRCIHNCKFCTSNTGKETFLSEYDEHKFVDFILRALKCSNLKTVALTSGIYPSNNKIIKKMVFIIKNVKKNFPNIPIGVEPCITKKEDIMDLKEAGADEIKINLQISDEKLFEKICPDFDQTQIFMMLNAAVKIFGKEKVTSNILYGLGENEDMLIDSIEKLAKIGVVPTLRKIYVNDLNKARIENALGKKIPAISADKMVDLAMKQKKIFEKYNLTTIKFKTMCHKCGCCDIVPFWDV